MKIIGQLVVGAGEADRYLEQTLKEFQRLCDDAIAVRCNTGAKEKKLLDKYDIRSYEDNREWGKFQPDIKTNLLRRIKKLQADWIVVLDADETMPTVTRQTLTDLAVGREACQFYVVNLWNDVHHYSKALSFWNVRFYQCTATDETQFLRKPVHCGNAPPYFYTIPARNSYVPHILLHTGLLDPADRQRKYQRYQQYDPHARHKGRDYYDALIADGQGSEYNQEEVLKKIQAYYATLQQNSRKP